MKKYKKTLQKAEKIFGVERNYITAIFALENEFGKSLGSRKVFNSLVTHCVYGKRKKMVLQTIKGISGFKRKII